MNSAAATNLQLRAGTPPERVMSIDWPKAFSHHQEQWI